MNMLMKTPKELMLEGKTKAYDEALAKAKELYSDTTTLSQPVKDVLEYIFPELKLFKKMEEEKIRLDIVDIIKSQKNINGPTLDKMIDWLDKQGEKLQESIREVSNKKPDKVKPKFKVGDWIVFDSITSLIYDVHRNNDTYGVKLEDGAFRDYDINVLDKKAHLWNTEEDAKVGDVLCSERDSIIIFAGVYGKFCKYHVALTIDGKLIVNENGGDHLWGLSNVACPATKEQQDLLFQKMAEKSYRWDSENKKVELLPIKKEQLKFDRPNDKISECASIKSRLSNVPEDLKPVADFIMRFAHWNLNKDEVSSPLAEIPLYIVLDALARREEK